MGYEIKKEIKDDLKVHGLNNWKVGKDVNRAHLWEEDQDFLLDRLDLLS